MLVSVILTTYNRSEKILKRAIDSVLNQTYKNIELIIVNDMNKCNPLNKKLENLIESYTFEILYIAEGINKGACYSRNLGFKHSTGDYIAFLDDDDTWNRKKIERQVDMLKTNKYSMVSVGYQIVTLDESQNVVNKRRIVHKNTIITSDDLLRKNIVGGSSAPLIKRESFIEVGQFDINMESAQDYDLWIRISNIGKIYYIREVLHKYYIYEGERISNNSYKKINGYMRLLDKHKELFNQKSLYLSNKQIIIAYHYYKLNNAEMAKKYFKSAISNNPFSLTVLNYLIKIITKK